MRRLVSLILFWGVLVTGCGPSHERARRPDPAAFAGTTGATDENGTPFVNPDPRMRQALTEPEPAPQPVPRKTIPEKKPEPPPETRKLANPPPPSAPVATPKKLALRMNEFEISRFAKGADSASRFGDDRIEVKIYFDDVTVTFSDIKLSGKDGNYSFKTKSGKFFLSGTLDDFIPGKSAGDFKILDTQSGEQARILYSAFKAKLSVREDITRPITHGSELDKQIRGLRENTFGWVNNWGVVLGTSFYIVDIVKVGDATDPNVLRPPMVALKGRSLRTGDADHPVESVLPYFPSQVSLIGNSETEDRRWFQTKLIDPNTREENEIIIDVQSEEAAAAQAKAEAEIDARIQANASAPPPPPPLPPAQPAQPQPEETPEATTQAHASGEVAAPVGKLPEEGAAQTPPPAEPPAQTPLTHSKPAELPPTPSTPPTPTSPSTPKYGTPSTPTQPSAPPKQQELPPPPKPPTPKPSPIVAQPPPQKPQPRPPAPAPIPQLVEIPTYNESAYLRIDTSLPRTARMTRDFDRNRNLPGVKKWIADYTSSWKAGWGRGLLQFYYSATSFRPIVEKVAATYDVSPAFAYVTVIESAYFTGGNYAIQWGGAAYGPFQLEAPTATRFGVRVGGGVDERKHFAPSACGAAKLFVYLTDMYPNDATIAIMGYNMGEGGAAGSIVCTYDRNSCGSSDYGRLLARAKNYRYTFADIATVRAAPAKRIEYVEKKLAAYFISNDLQRWGITVPQPGQLPANAKVFPPSGNGESPSAISDPVCRQAISSLFGS